MLGAKVKPDLLLSELKVDEYAAIVFVGGVGASEIGLILALGTLWTPLKGLKIRSMGRSPSLFSLIRPRASWCFMGA